MSEYKKYKPKIPTRPTTIEKLLATELESPPPQKKNCATCKYFTFPHWCDSPHKQPYRRIWQPVLNWKCTEYRRMAENEK